MQQSENSGGAGVESWKTQISSTIRTTSRMNAMLSDKPNLRTLVAKRKNMVRLKEAILLDALSSVSLLAVDSQRSDRHLPPVAPTIRPNFERIRTLLEETVAEQLSDEKFFCSYNSEISSKFCQILAREMRTKIKLLHLDR